MSFPDKETRKRCWSARDVFWECLDKNDDDLSKCQEQKKCFESNCSKSWVQHFNKKREYIKYKEKIKTEDPVEKLKEFTSRKQQ